MYTLELLHVGDQEGGTGDIGDIARLSAIFNALEAQDLGSDGIADNTLRLSSGDAIIPGIFFDTSETVFGSAGIADIQIQNELGFQAIALGNHEFDKGTGVLAGLIDGSAPGDIFGSDFAGAAFPYLSANLEFSTDSNLAPLAVAGGGEPTANTVTSSVVIDVNGEPIAVVGATTPTLGTISSPGATGIRPTTFDANPSDEELDALAAVIQAEVTAVLDANEGLNKVVLLSHMQRLDIELELAERLSGVDIIVAGGSNARLFDEDDRVRTGDEPSSFGDPAGTYPQQVINADGGTTMVVNTDGSYKYVGRLVIDFDENGEIIPESYDASVSGAYATDEQGVVDLDAADDVDPEIQAIVNALSEAIADSQGNVFGVSNVFLNRDSGAATDSPDDIGGERTQETSLGNLTADANLFYAEQLLGSDVQISLKNGGGIRASIGETVVPAGGTEPEQVPNQELTDADGNVIKPAGGISEPDIKAVLAFNNDLVVLTLTTEEIVGLLEHGIASLPGTSGRFPQLSGIKFSFDANADEGSQIQNAGIYDEDGFLLATLVRDGVVVEPDATFDVVTLEFLSRPRFDEDGNFVGGGDGYPFPNYNTLALNEFDGDVADTEVADAALLARLNPRFLNSPVDNDDSSDFETTDPGNASFAATGTEQDALAEYLDANFNPFSGSGEAYDEADVGPADDTRTQNLEFVPFDSALPGPQAPEATGELGEISVAQVFETGLDGGAEVVVHENGKLYVTNDELGRIDVWDILSGTQDGFVSLTHLPGFDSVQSVAVKNGLLAIAVSTPDTTDTFLGMESTIGQYGYIALATVEDLQVYDLVTVGNLPDMVTFNEDGTKILVANEGEFSGESTLDRDPIGSVSIIDVSTVFDPQVTTVDFSDYDGFEELAREKGVRLPDTASLLRGLEPEYITVEGDTAYITLQEANTIAVLDIPSSTFTNLLPLGTVDHSQPGFEIDPNDDETIGIYNFDVQGLRMPDAVDSFDVGGTTYLITANEGDGRGDPTDGPDDVPNPQRADEARLGDVLDGEIPGVSIDESVDTAGLERLTISLIDGDTDGDGDIDVLHSFGSRSFTIFDDQGNVVFDSGSQFEAIIADLFPERFNDDDGDTDEDRSDNKGPEPEAVTVGEIDGKLYAFIGLERDSGIMIYNVSDPANAYFVDYIPGFMGPIGEGPEDFVAPETIAFIPAAESTSGLPQIAVAYEVSGDTVVYDLGLDDSGEPAQPLIAEFRPNPTGSDPDVELLELSGEAGESFEGKLVFIESDPGGANPGDINNVVGVSGTFDENGLLIVDTGDVENPSFTVVLTDRFDGDTDTDLDGDNDGVADQNLDLFGTVYDAVGISDTTGEPVYGTQLGGTDIAFSGDEPRLAFRDAGVGDWYVVNDPDGGEVIDAAGDVVDPADFDTDPTAADGTFGSVNPTRLGAQPVLTVTEIWSGQNGADLTEDWFEITNTGSVAWTPESSGDLYYDDESADPSEANLISGIDSIEPGESVVVVVGNEADATAFAGIWGDDGLPVGTKVGWSDGAGLGGGGDAVNLFIDTDGDGLTTADTAFTSESYPNADAASGQSWEVAAGRFASLEDFIDTVETTETAGTAGDEAAIGSPGFIPTEGFRIEPTLISTIQGSGFSSALVGETVNVQGIVTIVSGAQEGFFLQEEDADSDGDAATSEGIFVFLDANPDVAIGDLVTLQGVVEERFGMTRLNAIENIVVEAEGVELPTSVIVELPLSDVTDPAVFYESVEGMLVTVVPAEGESLTVTDTFTRFGEVGVTAGDPLIQPTQAFPTFSTEQEELTAANARNVLLFENAIDDSLSGAPRVGDGIAGDKIEGAMFFSFGDYKVETDGAVDFDASVNPNPRQDAPAEVGGSLKVASFNVLNYFVTLRDGTNDARGARTPEELADQTSKIVAAISAMDADIVGLIEIENDLSEGAPDAAVAALVEAINAEMGEGTYDYVATGKVGDDAIKQALIYKPATVELKGEFAVLDTEDFTNPLGSERGPLSRPAIAQTFTEIATGESLTVSVNHLKSKGSPSGVEGDDSDVEGSAALTRVEAMKELAAWLATDPTGSGDADQLTIGDFNAYSMERAIQALEAEGYTNLADPQDVSYQFDGRLGTLDYAFANENLLDQIAGTTIWNVNSLEAFAQQYSDRNFDNFGDANSPFGSSDHDPVIVGLDLSTPTQLARLEFIDQKGRDKVVYTLDGEEVDSQLMRKRMESFEMEAAGITIGAEDGLDRGRDFITTKGQGLGVLSRKGDKFSFSERLLLDDRETLSFDLAETGGLDDAVEVMFEFKWLYGSGDVELTFFDDGELIDSAILEVADKAVSYALEDGRDFDRVELGVDGHLSLTVEAVEFLRFEDEFHFV